jgi:hypothetical protein
VKWKYFEVDILIVIQGEMNEIISIVPKSNLYVCDFFVILQKYNCN